MSRRTAHCRLDYLECEVGWDAPLETFFGQVFDTRNRDDEHGGLAVWMGAAPREVPTAAALAERLSLWVDIDAELIAALEADRTAEPAWPPLDPDVVAWVESLPSIRLEGHMPGSHLRHLDPEP
ncbi:MAG TPA: hypothetical protein VK988_12370 [Acidimicrobiales bacterium]|nr:hypothetical protein [Acidimicrobiales bacterium]